MTIPNDNLRLVLISLNELKQVAVLAAANRFGFQLFSMGVVRGKEQLQSFLEMAGIDYYVVCYGEPFVSTFKAAPFAHSPKEIADELEKSFEGASELRANILKGETVSEEDHLHLSFLPRSWFVYSSSVGSDEGIERMRAWFNANKAEPVVVAKSGSQDGS